MRAFWAGNSTRQQLASATPYSVAVRPVVRSEAGAVFLRTYSKALRAIAGAEEDEGKIYDGAAAMLETEACSQIP